jgi:hypothetical protein
MQYLCALGVQHWLVVHLWCPVCAPRIHHSSLGCAEALLAWTYVCAACEVASCGVVRRAVPGMCTMPVH